MKKTKFMALLLMAGLTFTACDEDENFNPNLDVEETVTVDFEGNYFTALVDTPQYNGRCSMASWQAPTAGAILPLRSPAE